MMTRSLVSLLSFVVLLSMPLMPRAAGESGSLGPFPRTSSDAQSRPFIYGRGGDLCQPGQAWSCTITCGPGTRYSAERLFGAPGAELCVVTACACRETSLPFPWAGARDDPTLPVALVIFGVDYLVGVK